MWVLLRPDRFITTDLHCVQVRIVTIVGLEELVDDISEVQHFRAGWDGERDVIHCIPATRTHESGLALAKL